MLFLHPVKNALFEINTNNAIQTKNVPILTTLKKGKRKDFFINPLVTARSLKIVGKLLQLKIKYGGKFLIVGSRNLEKTLVKKVAQEINAFYIIQNWPGGLLTNWLAFQKNLAKLKSLKTELADPELFNSLHTKKERNKFRKEFSLLEKRYLGVENMDNIPEIVLFLNPTKNKIGIHECTKLGITTISFVDLSDELNLTQYAIPLNKDSYSSLKFALYYLKEKIKKITKND